MHLTGTLSETNSLPYVWTLLIHLFPRYYLVTSMLFLTEPKIVGALILLSSSVRALSRSLELLLREFCVLDVWRQLHPDLRAYTWLKPDGSLSSRIDLIGFSSTCLHLVSSCSIVSCPFSHHDAVFPGFSIPELFPRGPGRWRLNVSILRDPVFFQTFSDFRPRQKSAKSSFFISSALMGPRQGTSQKSCGPPL